MKKVVFASLLIIYSFTVNAQALVVEGSEWFYDYNNGFWDPNTTLIAHMKYSNDTVLNNTLAHEIDVTIYDITNNTSYNAPYLNEYVYSNEDQVFRYVNGQFRLQYDFTSSVGDTIITYGQGCPDYQGESVIDSVGTINYDGMALRYLYLRTFEPFNHFVFFSGYIVERIGAFSDSGYYSGYLFPVAECISDIPYFEAVRCYKDNEIEVSRSNIAGNCDYGVVGFEDFSSNNTYVISQNLGERTFQVEFVKADDILIEIYNNFGQRIYIQNNINSTILNIDLSSHPIGIYHIVISREEGLRYSKKLMLY